METNTYNTKDDLLSIHEALDIIEDNMLRAECEECSLESSLGRYLGRDIHAPEPSPRFTNSAMDGFAVRWQDILSATKDNPAHLTIIGESQAGRCFEKSVKQGEAVRISTGAVIPDGCDTVIRVEDTTESDNSVAIHTVRCQGQDIRHRGEEFNTGDLLLKKGTRITASRSALLAAIGLSHVPVFAPCRVALLITGSELVSAGESIGDDQIRDSNMIMLKGAVKEAGGVVVHSIRVSDAHQATVDAIAGVEADIILCTGGVSMGRHDHVKNAAAENNFSPLFWKIRQKPGKPLFFARTEKTLLFGLPGNPVSAFMCFTHYVRPLILAQIGKKFGWPMVSGEAIESIANSGKRTNMIRVKLQWKTNGGYSITHAAKQGSHMLTSLAHGDGYIILEPGQELNPGERIDVYRYDFLRELV